MKKLIFTIIFVFSITNDVFACSPPPPGAGIHRLNNISPKIVSSSNGRFFLKLMPGKWVSKKRTFSGIQIREAYGIVFEVRKDGQFQQIWSFKNWDENNLVFLNLATRYFIYPMMAAYL